MKAAIVASEIRVMLFPKDFAKSRQFYMEKMGWPIQHEWDYGDNKGVMFDCGCATIELLWPRAVTNAEGNINVSLRVADVWSLWEVFAKQENTHIVFALRQNPWGDDSFCITDPEGTRLTFFTDPPSK
jgi:hypothetical protein